MIPSKKIIAPADRTHKVKYAIRDIVTIAEERKRQGKEVLSLIVGDPIKYDFETPPHIIEAIYKGMLEGETGYGPSQGMDEAVEVIKKHAKADGITGINQVCVTTGASEGIDLALTALVNPGENVLLPSPGFPFYSAVLSKLGADANFYYLDEDSGWQPDVADMEAKINDKTRAIVVINPNNPTGSLTDEATLRQVVELAQKYGLLIIADEIYDKLIFEDQKHVPMATVAGDHPCVTISGLAKSYLGPGLRTGWAILTGEPELCGDFNAAFMKMARARLCPNTPMQRGIIAALDGDQSHLEVMKKKVKARANLVVERINAIEGFSCVAPKGAFYVFPTIEDRASDWDFVIDMIKETGVLTVPGSGFGQRPGTKHIRIVLLPPEQILSEAMDRMEKFVKSRR